MNVEYRAVQEGEIDQCLNLWMRAWPNRQPGFFDRYVNGDADYQPEYTRVAVVNGRVVGTVQIVKRIVSCGDCSLTMGGIANVAADAEFRGQGIAQQCMRQAVQVMEADAFDFSLLFSLRRELYEKLGFEGVAAELSVGELVLEPRDAPSGIVVRPYEDRDDDAIRDLHTAYNHSRPMSVMRSAPYWRDWLGWQVGQAPGIAAVAEENGGLVGYCLYAVDRARGRVHVCEFGVHGERVEVLDALLRQAGADARMQGICNMSIPLHEERVVEEVSDRLFANKMTEPVEGAMIRFLHRDNLLSGLAPLLTDRWRSGGSPAGSLSIRGPYGSALLRSSGPFLRIEPLAEAAGALSQSELFSLLIGKGVPGDRLSAIDLQFANALFPASNPWFWEMDGF